MYGDGITDCNGDGLHVPHGSMCHIVILSQAHVLHCRVYLAMETRFLQTGLALTHVAANSRKCMLLRDSERDDTPPKDLETSSMSSSIVGSGAVIGKVRRHRMV